MPERQEIEVKFALDNPAAVRETLLRLGAAAQGRRFENNIRLDNPDRTLTQQKIVLRLRQIEQDGQSTTLLTIKTPAERRDSSLSTRNEIELEVGDGPAMLAALAVLGYTPCWRYEKRRETFTWEGVEAVIDELPFGWFIELEGSSEGIRALAGKLGFDMADGITLSYARIFENVCHALKIEVADLTFEAFGSIRVNPQVYRGQRDG